MNLSKYKVDLSAEGKRRTEERLNKCRVCPILSKPLWRCERNRSVNGIKGCGCLVQGKARMPEMYCPRGLWENGFEPK
jgi:hypothetical protein